MSKSRARGTNSRLTVGLADDKDEITLLGPGKNPFPPSTFALGSLSRTTDRGYQSQGQGQERELIKRTLIRTFIDRRCVVSLPP